MEQHAVLIEFPSQKDSKKSPKKRGGPPNRMNDLPYKEWMKFQKSFFEFQSSQELVEKCIYFFTKAKWPNEKPSRSLIIGFDNFIESSIPSPRIIDVHNFCQSIKEIVTILKSKADSQQVYDFVLIDLRSYIQNTQDISEFLTDYAEDTFRSLRHLLDDQKYCGIIAGTEHENGSGFPLPWSIALSYRNHLRLRDEKIALTEKEGKIFYCLFMRAEDDERKAFSMLPESISNSNFEGIIPSWTIPKPPQRKKNEILHPAKFPETLVEEFIELFTNPTDKVFDPMVGTGSVVIAAIRKGRDGYGVELSKEFVKIAKQRIEDAIQPTLFPEMQQASSRSLILQGNAMELDQLKELTNMTFDYVITSPPYWSMLKNPGSENQRARRHKKLKLVYSQDERDLGNVQDYE